jgi:hypothetical protein
MFDGWIDHVRLTDRAGESVIYTILVDATPVESMSAYRFESPAIILLGQKHETQRTDLFLIRIINQLPQIEHQVAHIPSHQSTSS